MLPAGAGTPGGSSLLPGGSTLLPGGSSLLPERGSSVLPGAYSRAGSSYSLYRSGKAQPDLFKGGIAPHTENTFRRWAWE